MYLNQISCLTQMKSCSEADLILCGSRLGLCQTRPHVRPKIRKFKSSTSSGKYVKDCPSASNRKRTTSGTNLSRTFFLRRTVSADQYESPRRFKQNFRTVKNNPGEDAGSSNEDKVERNKTGDKTEIDESLKNTCQPNRQHPEAALEVTVLTQAHEDVYNQKKHSKSAELLGQLTHGHMKELKYNTPKYKNNKDSLHLELKEISTYLDKTKENDVITVKTDIQDIVRDVDDKQLAPVEDQVNVPGNVVESQRFKSTTEMDKAVIPTGTCVSRQVYCSLNGTLPMDKNGESTLLEKHFLERKIESEESVLNRDYNTKLSSFTSEGQESLSAEQQKIVFTDCSENNIQNVNFGSHQAGDQVTITPILSGENKTAFSSNLREIGEIHQNMFSDSMEKEDSSHQNTSKITGSIANLNHSTEDKSDFNACAESRLITGKSKHPSLSCRDNLTSDNSSLLCDGFSGYAGQIKLEETGSNITWTEATQCQEEVSKQQSEEEMCVKYKNYQLHSSTDEKII
ncbi:uncharacterized protein LOC143237480 [Tachypleus tridentatus]|uniref:uncharacterized protein LOC143237480 n=1 Tax=Tachypleus tridentatus TaxID=6853 RepID=UPI003FD5266C